MGSLFGGGSAKKAAQITAKATTDAANMAAEQAKLQAESAVNQIKGSQAQRNATQAAEELLSRPMEQATVDLATQSDEGDSDDLLTRRRTTRQSYQSQRGAGIAV